MNTMNGQMQMTPAANGHNGHLAAMPLPDDEFLILDTRSANGVASVAATPRMNAIATISGGFRGDDNRPNRSRDGEIYIHGDAPGLQAALAARDGKSLTVMFPSDNPRDFIQQRFAEYTASAIKTYGDEKSVTEIHGEQRVTFLAGTPEYAAAIARCKVSVSVYFLLAEWTQNGADMVFNDGLGLYRLRSTSINSLHSILFSVQHMKKMTGGKIAGIPFDLFLRHEEHADPRGQKRAVWIWQAVPRPPHGIRFDASSFRQFADHGQQQIKMLQLEAPAPETIETAIEDAQIVEAEAVEEDRKQETGNRKPETGNSGPALCDARDYQKRYFAIASGTRYVEDEGRAEFIRSISGGTMHSLSAYLDISTEAHAQQMLDELQKRVAQETEDRKPETSTSDTGHLEGLVFEIPTGPPAAQCKSCNAAIYWIKTRAGKNMPVNADGTSHFSSCPNADQHRNGNGAQPAAPRATPQQREEYSQLAQACLDAGLPAPKPLLPGDSEKTAASRITKIKSALAKKQAENRAALDAEIEAERKRPAQPTPREAVSNLAGAVRKNADEARARADESDEADPFSETPLEQVLAAARRAGFEHGGDLAFAPLIDAINAQQAALFLKKPIATLDGLAEMTLSLITSLIETGRMTADAEAVAA